MFISECLIPTKNCCYKKDCVLPCPIVGCLRTMSTSPLGQASILKGGNGLHQGLVQSVPNFRHHWFTSQVCSHLTLQEVMIKPKVEQADEFIIHGSGASLTYNNAWKNAWTGHPNTLHNWNLNAHPLIKTYLLQCNAPKSTRPYTWKWRFAGTSPLINASWTVYNGVTVSPKLSVPLWHVPLSHADKLH